MSDQHIKFLKNKLGKKITIKEIKWICNQHYLGKLKKIVKVLGGMTNVNILVKTEKGRYVVRYLTFPTSKERINYIEDILLELKSASIPVVNALKNKSGEYFSYINNRFIQVYPYIKASKFNFSPIKIKSSANMLSKFHHALKTFKYGPLPIFFINPTNKNLEERLNNLYQNNEFIPSSSLERIESLYVYITEQWEKEDTKQLPKTIIHDDWHPGNQLYNKDGSVACILDFDNTQHGERIYDIAYALYILYIKSPTKKNNWSTLFLEGYGELLPVEKNILSLAVAKIVLFFIFQATEKRHLHKLEDRLKENGAFIHLLLSKDGKRFFL